MKPLIDSILVVDDIAGIRRLIAGALAGLVGEVHEADNGHTALELARTHLPGLVFLDLALPGLSGVDILREIRADSSLQAVPVVIVTALGTSDMARQAREAGATMLVEKPFRPAQLRAIVQQIAGGESPGSAA